MNKKQKILIQNQLASILQQYESKKKTLPEDALVIIDLLFGLFNIMLVTLGVKATSRNSHLPPSRDPHRAKIPRKSTKRKPGGIPGHNGRSLEQVENPDKIEVHAATSCDSCGTSLHSSKLKHVSRHQVFDIKFSVSITEHQVEHKVCDCGNHQSGNLPDGISSAPCSYGPSVKALAIDLTQVQFVPLKRASQFFISKFGLSVSETSIMNFNREFYEKLKTDWEPKARQDLKDSEVLHADETGININTKTAWIHSLSNDLVVLMRPHMKRGSEAMDEIGIIPNFHSILCHDFWACYGAYDVIHACCHSHLDRELTKAEEEYGQSWAKKMSKLLQGANKKRKEQDGILSWKQIEGFEKKYTKIIRDAEIECPLNKSRDKSRGKIGQEYPRRLLNRLKNKRDWVLMFLYDPRVPFTNNQAERDIRMAKVQQKVSGCFRTFEGAERFCLARSFIQSMNRQGRNVPDAIEALFRGS